MNKTILFLCLLSINSVSCSDKSSDQSIVSGGGGGGSSSGGGKGGGFNIFNSIVKLTKKVVNTISGASDKLEPSYAALYFKESQLKTEVKKLSEASFDFGDQRKLNRFPEASALSPIFIRDATALFDTWMELQEGRIFNSTTIPISKHILWSQVKIDKVSTSFFVYRPSYEAELGVNKFFPHIGYHEEAEKTVEAVIQKVRENPNDQFIFMGLQGGGIVALLHAWMVVASVPIINKNLFEYNGELHQIKIFMYDSDCALSNTHYGDFPIPSWDVLRFYSGKSAKVNPEFCQFDLMKPLGLKYAAESSIVKNAIQFFTDDYPKVTREQFWNYYFHSQATAPAVNENIDHGIFEEEIDDAASTAASDISMTVDGYQARDPFGTPEVMRHKQFPIKVMESTIKSGIDLLRESLYLTKTFFNQSKEIFNSQFNKYLRRNVATCSNRLQDYLAGILTGYDQKTELIKKVIKAVECSINKYDKKSKRASIYCHLTGEDDKFMHAFQFDAHVQNAMEEMLTKNHIDIIESWDVINPESVMDYEEGGAPRTNSAENLKNPAVAAAAGGVSDDYRFRSGNSVAAASYQRAEDSHSAEYADVKDYWEACLSELFQSSQDLFAINPFPEAFNDSESVSVQSSVRYTHQSSNSPGKVLLNIELPFSQQKGVCEFNLKTRPFDYVRMYRHSSPMFFSVFSRSVVKAPFPSACEAILSAPTIPSDYAGNSVAHAKNLNAYFNAESVASVDQRNITVDNFELSQFCTNFPSQDAFTIFNPPLLGKLAECLAKDVIPRSYDCNSHLTLWASRRMCPDICLNHYTRNAQSNEQHYLHICSRVIYCDEGLHIGFRGTKFGVQEPPVSETFYHVDHGSKAYYAAFQLNKHAETFTEYLDRPIRFAVFFTEAAKEKYVDSPVRFSAARSISSNVSSVTGVSGVIAGNIPAGISVVGVAGHSNAVPNSNYNSFSYGPYNNFNSNYHSSSDAPSNAQNVSSNAQNVSSHAQTCSSNALNVPSNAQTISSNSSTKSHSYSQSQSHSPPPPPQQQQQHQQQQQQNLVKKFLQPGLPLQAKPLSNAAAVTNSLDDYGFDEFELNFRDSAEAVAHEGYENIHAEEFDIIHEHEKCDEDEGKAKLLSTSDGVCIEQTAFRLNPIAPIDISRIDHSPLVLPVIPESTHNIEDDFEVYEPENDSDAKLASITNERGEEKKLHSDHEEFKSDEKENSPRIEEAAKLVSVQSETTFQSGITSNDTNAVNFSAGSSANSSNSKNKKKKNKNGH